VAVELGNPDELMAEYQDITRQLQAAQQALKTELLAALKATSGEAG
jgi:type I restriction enzyme M protein